MRPPEVLVVGAGPTGLTSACELARHGHRVRIIDKAPAPSSKSKAFGIHARTLELFENIGVVDAILAAGSPASGVAFYDSGEPIVRLALGDQIASKYPFFHIIAQSETERVLTEHLASYGVAVEREVALVEFTQDDDRVTARLRHADGREEDADYRYLIGNDGAHSVVRKQLGLTFEGGAYPDPWLLADIDLDWDYPYDELSIMFHGTGLTAFFPLHGRRGRLMFEVPGAEIDVQQPEPTLADVERLCRERKVSINGVSNPVWLAWFRLHHRIVDRYSIGRVFVGGDAAHIHSPVGGQGMNMGIQDAYNLAWKLALVLRGAAAPTLLDSYGVERLRVDKGIVDFTDRATKFATIHNPVFSAIRKLALKTITRLGSVRARMVGQLSQVELHYRKSPIVAESWSGPTGELRAGERVPDFPLVRDGDGSATVLYELLTGAEHELLMFCGVDPTPADIEALRAISEALPSRLGELVELHLVHGPAVPDGAPVLDSSYVDPDMAMHEAFGAKRASLVLVRPDGYIAYRNQPADLAALSEYIDTIFT